MLQTELSESLRRNLLWERQVSRINMAGRRGGVLGSGLRPLTSMNGADTPVQPAQGSSQGQQQQQPGVGSGSTGQPAEKQDWLDKGVQSAGEKAGIDIVRVLCATYHNKDRC